MSRLPRLMLVTQRDRMRPDFMVALEAALRGGARLVQLREKDLPDAELLPLAMHARSLCGALGAKLLINSRVDVARLVNADGVHLPEGGAVREVKNALRKNVFGEEALCGVSVHTLEAARRAAEQGADYLIFGSIFPTPSHPGVWPAGLNMLREVCAAVPIPVFAIGGITAQNAQECLAAGAHGVAVIGAAWDAEGVTAAVRELIETVGGY